jgi:pimeloyl-ACP methyl ester carboxylesterase
MTDAIHAMLDEIRSAHAGKPVDALALSLSSEFLARAAAEKPHAVRSLALVSPTGFDRRATLDAPKDATRANPWLHRALESRLWSQGLFDLLTSRRSIRYFLEKTYGSKHIDEDLLDYDHVTARQPGARHAPYYFVSGYLFSKDILAIYTSLTMPVWFSHGVRGDFVDYFRKDAIEDRANWAVTVFDTGALPHFEARDAFVRAYDEFAARLNESVRQDRGSSCDEL